MAIVPYSDDFVMSFERKVCARRMVADLPHRMARFGLKFQGEKTRLIEIGRFVMKRKTQRLHRKLKLLRAQVRTRMHQRVALQHRWLCAVLGGHYGNYGVTSNFRCLNSFYYEVKRLRFRSLGKRDQRGLTWDCFQELFQVFPLPSPGSLTVARRDFVATYSFESSRMHEGALTEQ